MRIYKIKVQNYRGIRNSGWIEFDKINAIVGKNDAGKSSILHAINEFYNENKLLDGSKHLGAETGEVTEIEICFTGEELRNVPKVLLDDDSFLHLKKTAQDVGETYKRYIIVKDFEKIEYRNLFQLTTAKYNSLYHALGKECPDDIDMNAITNLVNELLKIEINSVEGEYEVKSTILKQFLEEILPQFSLFLADTDLDTSTSSFQNQFKRIVTNTIETHITEFSNLQQKVSLTLIGEINKIGQYMETHYSELTELKPNIVYDWQKLINFDVIMKDLSGYEISLSNKGTGIQRLFMVSYFQYLAEQSAEDERSYIFVIEEPETFLHPGAQRTLLDSLKHISKVHQVIITTHSPVFASEIENKYIIVASKENGESVYKQGDLVSAELLVKELGVLASDNILNSKLLVFVEGSNDVKFWGYIYKAVIGHTYEEDNILFVPGGGTELHNIAEMNLMSKLNRNFLVIIDKDAGAIDYKDKLIKQNVLKEIVEGKGGEVIILRKREIENYYSPQVVRTMLMKKGFEIEEFDIDPYEDFPDKMKTRLAGQNAQLKLKNNMDVFERMTLEDWENVSRFRDDDGREHFELGEIVKQIREKASMADYE